MRKSILLSFFTVGKNIFQRFILRIIDCFSCLYLTFHVQTPLRKLLCVSQWESEDFETSQVCRKSSLFNPSAAPQMSKTILDSCLMPSGLTLMVCFHVVQTRQLVGFGVPLEGKDASFVASLLSCQKGCFYGSLCHSIHVLQVFRLQRSC